MSEDCTHTLFVCRAASASGEKLTVAVPSRVLWLEGIFLRKKERCAGVVGTRTDWVLEGKGVL